MCGISGFIGNGQKPLRDLRLMTDVIAHRGPDDEGFVVFSDHNSSPICLGGKDTPAEVFELNLSSTPRKLISSVQDLQASVALGNRRLSILDLSAKGHQPMCSADNTLWITFNGEIYNYIELRAELLERGHRFISDTDTEVILAAYQEWGVQCLDRFNGMWGFVIYDRSRNEIFMARDRFGIKPLYYWFDNESNFHFGSEIKQFTVCEGWQAKVNSQRAFDFLVYSLTDHTDETMFEGVYHIPPGHYYKAGVDTLSADKNGKIKAVKWYDLSLNLSNLSFEEACSGFENYFKDAIRMNLRSDVSVGSALSGGLDSSAIVCEISNSLAEEGKKDIQKTFSSCSEFEKYDEKKWVDIVVNHTNVDAYFIYPGIKDMFGLTSTILWHQDEPYQSQSAYLGYHVFQLAREKGVKVLLNGQGADEYLGGYGQFNNAIFFQMFKSLRWGMLNKQINKTRDSRISKALGSVGYLLMPAKIRNLITRYFSSSSDIKHIINFNKLGASNRHPYTTIQNDVKTVSGITKLNLFHNPLTKYLRWEDRNAMAHSIEARVPFLDHRLVEFTFNLPADYLLSNGTTKRILRQGLKDILPCEIANRKDKKGFITPEERWVKSEHTELFREKLKDSITRTGGIIKEEALKYFDDVVSGIKPFDYTYIRLILFAEWAKIFNVDLRNQQK